MIAEVPVFALAVETWRKAALVAAATVSIAAVAATSVVVGSKTDEPAVKTIQTEKGRSVRGAAHLLMPRSRERAVSWRLA